MAKPNRNLARYKRTITYEDRNKQELLKIAKQRVTKANQMINSLKRRHGKSLSWAGRILESRLTRKPAKHLYNVSKQIIRMPSSRSTTTELTQIIKAIDNFMKSKTSTNVGVEKVKKQHRDYLIEITDDEDFVNRLTDEEIDNVYRIYNDRNIRNITDYIPPSELFALCMRAKQYNMSYNSFEEMLLNYIGETNNLDFRDSIIRVYEVYVRG